MSLSKIVQEGVEIEAEKLARYFHIIYESLSKDFGYTTREETRFFDEVSPNGKLMIATCAKVLPTIKLKLFEAELGRKKQVIEKKKSSIFVGGKSEFAGRDCKWCGVGEIEYHKNPCRVLEVSLCIKAIQEDISYLEGQIAECKKLLN